MENKKLSPQQKRASVILWVILLVLLWEVIAFIMDNTKRSPENFLPHLHQIIGSVFSDRTVTNRQTALQIVLDNAGLTLFRAGLGFALGMAVGFFLALLMRMFNAIEKIAFPYLMMIQMIPILGMAPIVLALTRDINASRIIIAALLTFYPVATNTLAGLRSVEKEKLDLMYSLSASPWHVYTKLLIPSAMPYLFTGLKIAAPMAITASILVDTLQGSAGLGTILSQSLKRAMTIYVFWQIVFLSALVGILAYQLIVWLERWISPQVRAGRS